MRAQLLISLGHAWDSAPIKGRRWDADLNSLSSSMTWTPCSKLPPAGEAPTAEKWPFMMAMAAQGRFQGRPTSDGGADEDKISQRRELWLVNT